MKSDMGEMQKLDLNKERAVGFVEAVRTASQKQTARCTPRARRSIAAGRAIRCLN